MSLDPQKRRLLSQQRNERAHLLAQLEQLDAEYSKDLELINQRTRAKALRRESDRRHRQSADKDMWEILNDVVEVIHTYTWGKSVTGICTKKYTRRRQDILEDLRDLDNDHRKERIKIRYRNPPDVEERPPHFQTDSPHFDMS